MPTDEDDRVKPELVRAALANARLALQRARAKYDRPGSKR